jgi:hypothetical protein
METTVLQERRTTPVADVRGRGPSFEAFSMLYFAYIIAPIVAGVDKFFHYLVDWNIYVSPAFAKIFGGNIVAMMDVVGVVEIVAGIIVALRPRVGGVIVAIWLWGIILNLLLIPGFFDVALRDFGLSLGALALSRLSVEHAR